MDMANDELTKEEAFAGVMFLYSERLRHLKDIEFIDNTISKMMLKNELTGADKVRAFEMACRYVEF